MGTCGQTNIEPMKYFNEAEILNNNLQDNNYYLQEKIKLEFS